MKYLAIIVLLLSACASAPKSDGTPEQDYAQAKRYIEMRDYTLALETLEKFSTKHPYSQFSVQAELLRAYAAYEHEEYALAETLCVDFINRHPRHPDVAYAHYLIGLIHYEQIAAAKKDQGETHAAIDAFNVLIGKFPDSEYARDATERMPRLYNLLAEHELTIGKFYYKQDRFVAAANRFQVIVSEYQASPFIAEALFYLAASYEALNMDGNALETASLLHHNYPQSKWSEKAEQLQ